MVVKFPLRIVPQVYMTSEELLKQVMDTMGYTGKKIPEIFGSFQNFNKATMSPGVLDIKTKELIAVALSLSSTCEWCITYHAKMALDNGATEDEILEASFVAVLMAGAPALMHMQILKQAIESFRS